MVGWEDKGQLILEKLQLQMYILWFNITLGTIWYYSFLSFIIYNTKESTKLYEG